VTGLSAKAGPAQYMGLIALGVLGQPILDRGGWHRPSEQLFDFGMDVTGSHRATGVMQNPLDGLWNQATSQALVLATAGTRSRIAGCQPIQLSDNYRSRPWISGFE
jgi:hypothetical protein